ncbi:MAG: 4Fe-4S binding protein [Syntrophales bacterium]|nr:4Fe-4S binding protein [Syntrophales bacterium]
MRKPWWLAGLRVLFIKNINPKWTYLPYAVLLLAVIGAAVTLTPVYCEWLCPFKTTTEYDAIVSVKTLIQTIIFVSLFAALVVALPLLTKRRTQCSLFCPFGAFQSFTNRLNVFEVRVDPQKCVKCGKCARECPVLAVNVDRATGAHTAMTCTKCGKCVDVCPKGAAYFHVKGVPVTGSPAMRRLLFLYPAFLFLAALSGRYMQDTIVRVAKFVTTGSFTG